MVFYPDTIGHQDGNTYGKDFIIKSRTVYQPETSHPPQMQLDTAEERNTGRMLIIVMGEYRIE